MICRQSIFLERRRLLNYFFLLHAYQEKEYYNLNYFITLAFSPTRPSWPSWSTQLSINGVGFTKPLTASLNPTSKHSSQFKKPSKGCR